MSGTLAPIGKHQFFDNNGDPLAGGLLYTYAAGTTTPLATYSDQALTVPNENPIELDPAGRSTIYLSAASYKFVLQTAAGVTVWTQDHISAVPNTTVDLDITGTAGEALTAGQVAYLSAGDGGLTAGRWYKADADLTYASSAAGTVGVVVADIASGASGAIRLQGRITGLSGLTIGAPYYVSATGGALTATAPANARLVGVADSLTSLVITANPRPLRADGAVGSPGIAFAADPDTGIYREGADRLSFATGGVKALEIDATRFLDSPTQPRCAAWMSGTQSLSNATATAVTFDEEDYDVGGLHDPASNNTRFTIPAGGDGLYLLIGGVNFAASGGGGSRSVWWKKNGTTDLNTLTNVGPGSSGTASAAQSIALVVLAAGDYVELFALQASTAALNIGHASDRTVTSSAQVVKLW
jgi:hypothetical protein